MRYNFEYVSEEMMWETQFSYMGNHVVSKELKLSPIDGGTVRPEIGLTCGGRYYPDSYIHTNHPFARTVDFSQGGEVESDEEVFFLGTLIGIWGHCLTDCLKHVWPIVNEAPVIKNLPLVYVRHKSAEKIPDNFWKLLSLMGIDVSHVREVTSATRFRRVWFADPCFFTTEVGFFRYCTPEFGRMYERILDSVPADASFPKIYFTRTGLKVHNRDYGEKSVEKIFRAKGYEIISPEKMSLEAMISILKGCDDFAATDGSIAHNSLFLKKGTRCVFVRKTISANSYQAPVNQIKELDVTIIDANLSWFLYYRRAPWDGPFFIYCNKRLRKWAGTGSFFPLWDFIAYAADGAGAGIKAKLFHR